MKLFISVLLLASFVPSFGVDIFSDEPLSTSLPWNSEDHPLQPSNLIADNLKGKPLPTNAWWQNLILENGDNRVTTLPYQMNTQQDGLHVCLPNKVVESTYIITAFLDSLVFASTSGLGNRQVVAFDELSVTLKWDNGAGSSLEVPLVRGMAYVTLMYTNIQPTIGSIHAFLNINGQNIQPGMEFSGEEFQFEMNNGQVWVLYLSAPATIIYTGQALTFKDVFNGSIRAAMVANPGMKDILDQHKNAIPVGGSIEAFSNGNSVTMNFNFQTSGSGDLLMMALPHHQDLLNPDSLQPQVGLECLKGTMIGVTGSTWSMVETMTSISWYAPRPVDSDKIEAVREALRNDIGKSVEADDTYFGGKQMAAIARLALIADELGETDLAEKYRSNVKAAIEPWLKSGGKLIYDRLWGGIIDLNGDFGMNYYNDHHFHYGYFVYAAAVIAKGDPGWVQTYGDAMMSLIRDYSNPSKSDPHFTYMRSKDWFVGHSWAAGLYAFADARNQESTSESVNGWYAIALYGMATNNERLADLGRLALATEIRSVKNYWQIKSGSNIYPAPFADNKVVGILWGTKVDYATFFGANTEFIHCIQMLPFLPISEELLPADWIIEEYPILSTAIGSAQEGWKGFIYMAHAIIDKAAAWTEVNTLTAFDDGNTLTNTLYWVATRP